MWGTCLGWQHIYTGFRTRFMQYVNSTTHAPSPGEQGRTYHLGLIHVTHPLCQLLDERHGHLLAVMLCCCRMLAYCGSSCMTTQVPHTDKPELTGDRMYMKPLWMVFYAWRL